MAKITLEKSEDGHAALHIEEISEAQAQQKLVEWYRWLEEEYEPSFTEAEKAEAKAAVKAMAKKEIRHHDLPEGFSIITRPRRRVKAA